jgi:adenylosuccinate synthase
MSKVVLLAGLGYGDEGKGTITDYLTSTTGIDVVVRYNGGPQAAHNVVAKGKHHLFAQFGSGTLAGAMTYLAPTMIVDPLRILSEARHLEEIGVHQPLMQLFVDTMCLMVTPYHRAMNRLREIALGNNRNGSCGMGIGETVDYLIKNGTDAPRIDDTRIPRHLEDKLALLRERLKKEADILAVPILGVARGEIETLRERPDVLAARITEVVKQLKLVDIEFFADVIDGGMDALFEGAQGVLLDQDFGFQPHTTWTDTTFGSAYDILKAVEYDGPVERVGVLRTFSTRHGPGPFVTEEKIDDLLLGDHNVGCGEWQGNLRGGPLDLVATRYALEVIGGVDYLALTHCDKFGLVQRVCNGYRLDNSSDYDSEFFDEDFSHIKVNKPPVFEYQEELTKVLQKVSPMYDTVPRIGLIPKIEKALGASVGVVSLGPERENKANTIL